LSQIKPEIIQIFQNRAPVDTGLLKSSIVGEIKKERSGEHVLLIKVKKKSYSSGSTNTRDVALKLEIGLSPYGKLYLRSKSQPSNPAKTPTKEWFKQAIADTKKYLRESK